MSRAGVSIVLPVHNGAKKVKRAVKSVLNQEYQDWELIVVENGSTDDTLRVCERLQKSDDRIKVIVSAPSTSMARKAGVLRAQKEYVTFMDHDDYYTNNKALSGMIKTIISHQSDIVQFGVNVRKYGVNHVSARQEWLDIQHDQLMEQYIGGLMGEYRAAFTPTLWDKIYRTDLVKDASMQIDTSVRYGNDMYQNLFIFFHPDVKRVSICPEAFYSYNTGIGSSGKEDYSEKLFDCYRIIKPLALKLAKENHVGWVPIVKCHRETLNFLNSLIVQKIMQREKKEAIVNRIQEYRSWDFVKEAAEFFLETTEQEKPWDDHIIVRSRLDDAEAYYDRCMSELGNVPLKQIQYHIKQQVRKLLCSATG